MIFIKLYLIVWAVLYTVMIYKALCKSNFNCLGIFHNYEVEYDSEAEKWKNGRMPMRISVGGFTRYKCTKCGRCYTEEWSVF
jgi:hypothetical protein